VVGETCGVISGGGATAGPMLDQPPLMGAGGFADGALATEVDVEFTESVQFCGA